MTVQRWTEPRAGLTVTPTVRLMSRFMSPEIATQRGIRCDNVPSSASTKGDDMAVLIRHRAEGMTLGSTTRFHLRCSPS